MWLPPGYRQSDADYPVLYVHDGHNCFDPETSYAGADWQLDEVIVGLADAGRIEAPIVVAPYTDDYRMEEYWVGPTGMAYLEWMCGDLKEMIDSTYRTRRGREDAAVMGSSMGGLGAFRAAWHREDLFSGAACLSPAFATTGVLIAEVAESSWPRRPLRLYIDNGGDWLDTVLQGAIDAMLEALRACGFAERGTLEWYRDEGAPHHESAWSQRVWRPLELLFGPR